MTEARDRFCDFLSPPRELEDGVFLGIRRRVEFACKPDDLLRMLPVVEHLIGLNLLARVELLKIPADTRAVPIERLTA